MMKIITQQAANTLKSLHQNCFKFPNESRNALKYLSHFKRFYCSTVSDSNFDSLFVMERCQGNRNIKYRLIDQKGTMTLTQSQDLLPYEQDSTFCCASNSCNGMLLIRTRNSLFMCNPSTGYMVKVLTLDFDSGLTYVNDFGLCYDESFSDYKAVIQRSWSCSVVVEASLKGKKLTNVNFPFGELVERRNSVVVKNRFHWIASKLEKKSYSQGKIFQFDPVSSVFEELPSPPPILGVGNKILGIGTLEGCLWMIRLAGDRKRDVEVLKMEKYGVKESWTTMCVLQNAVSVYSYTVIPLLITQNGEFLYQLGTGAIMAYNFETNLSTTYYTEKVMGSMQVVPFTENFASPEGYYLNQDEHDQKIGHK